MKKYVIVLPTTIVLMVSLQQIFFDIYEDTYDLVRCSISSVMRRDI
jgi:hypothetical protein